MNGRAVGGASAARRHRPRGEERAMANAFEVAIHARWPDMDQNGHMRTVAYLEVAEDSRMQ